MKLSSFFLLTAVASLAGFGGWKLGSRPLAEPASTSRQPLFYQSPMHPWIKSDHPGNCTICGMKLVPVYDAAPESAGASGEVVKLSEQSASAIEVATAPVLRQPLRRTIHVAGQIDDDESAHRRLSAYVEGRIDKLFVNFMGAEVAAGQPLALLYSRELLIARGEYAQAVKQPPSPERENFLAASRQKLRRLGLTIEQIEKLPSHTGDTFEILAPMTGTVVERKVYEGQYVKEGEVLFEIADFSKMWFVFDAYERDLGWIRQGQEVEVTTPSVPGKIFRAPITFIDPNVVMETRSAKVRVVLENPPVGDPGRHRHELLHKIFADGRIKVETEPVLTIPRTAVLSPGGDPVVYLAGDHGRGYELRRVTLGRAGDADWEILAGLAEGERVVTTGNLLIDAQAQLDHPRESTAPADEMSSEQQAAAQQLFMSAAAVADALASDDLKLYNARIPAFAQAATETGGELAKVAKLGTAESLVTARKQFFPLSMAVAELALRGRGKDAVKVFECPMAKSAVPSAETNQGRWVQMKAPLRNPFFGAEMLECGSEVKP